MRHGHCGQLIYDNRHDPKTFYFQAIPEEGFYLLGIENMSEVLGTITLPTPGSTSGQSRKCGLHGAMPSSASSPAIPASPSGWVEVEVLSLSQPLLPPILSHSRMHLRTSHPPRPPHPPFMLVSVKMPRFVFLLVSSLFTSSHLISSF